ncbi:MAG: Mut7-C RNAse domain-containing protein [Thermodesulfobacteriota bacterium]
MLFVADSMLGALAKYLRIMGYDTAYHPHYTDQQIKDLVGQGRVLVTRSQERARQYENSIFVDRDLVKEQLEIVDEAVRLSRDRTAYFGRCIRCNSPLEKAEEEVARERVPDYIFSTYKGRIFFCPSCGRCYWPGTHREGALKLLEQWGF